MFAAEASGRPGFVVPGLIASMVAQLFMRSASASTYQVAKRAGHLERRFDLPIATALATDVTTVPPDATLAEFFWNHLLAKREQAVAVGHGGRHLGVMRVEELRETPQEDWESATVAEHIRSDLPTAAPAWPLPQTLTPTE